MKENSPQNNTVFLLGGRDLEMEEISLLLKAKQVPFLDAKLDWSNAHWDQYLKAPFKTQIEEYSNSGFKIYGIELQGSPPKGENFGNIDHHNDKQDLPSAIEQVAELLGIKLNRWQQLVAANDKGYIPGLLAIGATQKEIDEVRKADRKAQGVSEEDEEMALASVANHATKFGDLTVVYSIGDRFSPIPDLLFGKQNKLLLFNDSNLVYYGKDKDQISQKFKDLIQDDLAYEGGGESGFFGLKKGKFDKSGIQEIKELIVNIS